MQEKSAHIRPLLHSSCLERICWGKCCFMWSSALMIARQEPKHDSHNWAWHCNMTKGPGPLRASLSHWMHLESSDTYLLGLGKIQYLHGFIHCDPSMLLCRRKHVTDTSTLLVESRIIAPQDDHVLNPRTWGTVALQGTQLIVDAIMVKDLGVREDLRWALSNHESLKAKNLPQAIIGRRDD